MAGKKIKKTTFLFPKTELDIILSDIISLEIMDISEPSLTTDDTKLESAVKTKIIHLDDYNTNRESITLLSTDTTYYLTGWISVKSEEALKTMISKYTCAWDIEAPTSDELANAPIILKRPKFLYRFYRGHRALFSALRIVNEEKEDHEINTDENEINDVDSNEG